MKKIVNTTVEKIINTTIENLKIKKSEINIFEELKDNFDPEIFDFVVVLNSLGFSTFSSCQGHPERNGYLPFVLCCNNYAEDLPLMSKICGSIKKTSKNIIDSLEDELTDTLQEQNRMSKYLSEFYIDRETPMKYRLILSTNIFCRFSIEPYMSSIINGSDIPESHKKEFNSICLKEIHDFTDFLKTKL